MPLFVVHPSGRIIAYWWSGNDGGELRAWEGRDWSAVLKCPLADNLSVAANGNILLSKSGKKEIRIQEVVLKEAAEANP